MSECERLEKAIAALEAQRAILGAEVVDTMIAAAREKLNALREAEGGRQPEDRRQRKQVTVLFADVSGFTAMAETMDAEDVTDTMNDLWSRLDAAITAQGGSIDKHIGDAVMALFGAPVAHEDDPERAIRAALAMQKEIQSWDRETSSLSPRTRPVSIRIGINTGPVLLGQVGTTFEYTAMGDTVNLASRLEHAAPVGGILISHDTYRHVRGIFSVQTLEPIAVKGKTEPVQVYVVQSVKSRVFRIPTRGVEGIETRMIGRDAELERLQDALHKVMRTQKAHTITIVGEAGVGKSRLLYEFDNWIELLPGTMFYFRGRADQSTSKLPYSLIRDIFAFRFDIKNSDCAATAREKLEHGIIDMVAQSAYPDGQPGGAHESDNADACMWAHFVGHLIGFDFSDSSYLRGILDDVKQIHDRAFHYIAQFFTTVMLPPASSPQASAAQADEIETKPAVLFLEDIHWADDGSLDLIEHLASECHSLPLLIVALTRPDFLERRPAWGEKLAPHTRIDLIPLSRQDSHRLVDEILNRVDQIPAELHKLIVDRAEGNPFYIEELIKMLIEDGIIVKGTERWRVEPGQLSRSCVPQTLVGVLQARMDGLPSPERQTLQRASVVGRVFWDGAVESLAKLTDGAPAQLATRPDLGEGQSALQALQERELTFKQKPSAFAGEQEYIFKHTILHDVAYESVLKQQRRIYHVRVATWLVEHSGQRTPEYAGVIGEHYERAGEALKAAEWYGRAGKQAQDTYAPQAAIGYYQKALDFLPTETLEGYAMQRVEYYRGLGLMLWQQTRFDEAAQAYTTMLTVAEAAGDVLAQAQAWEELSRVQQAQGDYRAALESVECAAKIIRAKAEPAQESLARVLCNKGLILSDLGEAETALSLGEQALALSRQLKAQRVIADSLNLLGWAHKTVGHYEQATRFFEEALAVFKELGDRVSVGGMLNNLGAIAISREDYQEAGVLYQDALAIAREIGHRYAEIVVLSNLGGAQAGMGEYLAAETNLQRAVDMAEAIGWGGLPGSYSFLAEAYLGQGKITQALSAAQRALELGQETGAQEDIGEAWRVLGAALAAAESPESIMIKDEMLDAPTCFARSLRIFTETGMEGERARTLRAWARYELDRGDRERGEKMGQEAHDILARLGVRKTADKS